MDIKWRKAKAGMNFKEDTIVIPIGCEDKDPRLVRCAIYDSIYIRVSDLKKIPIED